jgi:hypothetical protein
MVPVPKSSAQMTDQESFNESEASYVLAENLETSCHLSNYFKKSNVPLTVFSRVGTFDPSVDFFEEAGNIEKLEVSWCSSPGDSDDSGDSDSDDSDSDDEGDDHGLHESAGLACILLQRREVPNNFKDLTPPNCTVNVNTRSADSTSQNRAKCVRFPPAGKEVSRRFECPWVQKSDDYCALFYSSREIQQMKDAEIAEMMNSK